MRDIQVVFITAVPLKGLAVGNDFEVGSIHVVAGKHVALRLAKVTADNRDDTYVSEKAGRDREVRRGASEHSIALAERRFDCIKSD